MVVKPVDLDESNGNMVCHSSIDPASKHCRKSVKGYRYSGLGAAQVDSPEQNVGERFYGAEIGKYDRATSVRVSVKGNTLHLKA